MAQSRLARETDKVRKKLGQPSIKQQRNIQRLTKETDKVRKKLGQPSVAQQRATTLLKKKKPYRPQKR